jgi:ATP-dependent Lhr-like helicase
LLRQAFDEVMTFQMEQVRMREGLERLQKLKVVITELERLSPFSFPIFAEHLQRNKLSNEQFEDKVNKLISRLKK